MMINLDSPSDQHCYFPYIHYYYYMSDHDDFMSIYADKQLSFAEGYRDGKAQAETYDFSESIANAELLGTAVIHSTFSLERKLRFIHHLLRFTDKIITKC